MDEASESIIGNARKNRDELVVAVEELIKQLEELREECERKKVEFFKKADTYKIKYEPDTEILTEISYFIENLQIVKQKLAELKLDEKSILNNEEEYLNVVPNLIEKINAKIELDKEEFIKNNKEKIEASRKKLAEKKEELRVFEEEKQAYKEKIEEIENKKNKYKFLKWFYKGDEEYYRDMLEMAERDIRRVKSQIDELQIRVEENPVVPKVEGTKTVEQVETKELGENLNISEEREPGDE